MSSEVYILESVEATPPAPVTLVEVKAFMKVKTTSDDDLINSLIAAATEWGEKYTGRAFRIKNWVLKLDCFPVSDRIILKRDPVESIARFEYLVNSVLTTVPSADYYLKKCTQHSEIVLSSGSSWPDNLDDIEQSIEIEFVMKSYHCEEEIKNAIKRHVNFLYRNRGDCDGCSNVGGSGAASGATLIYDQFRITRV